MEKYVYSTLHWILIFINSAFFLSLSYYFQDIRYPIMYPIMNLTYRKVKSFAIHNSNNDSPPVSETKLNFNCPNVCITKSYNLTPKRGLPLLGKSFGLYAVNSSEVYL